MGIDRNIYGAIETNGLEDGEPHPVHALQGTAVLGDEDLAKITRLRLISDPGFPFWDLSYCYGELKDGTPVEVILPRYQFSKRRMKFEIVEMFDELGLHAKKMGAFDALSTLC